MKEPVNCPFCGVKPEFVMKRECCGHGEFPMFGYIICHRCDFRTEQFIIDGYYGCKYTIDTVVDHWNLLCDKIRGVKK